MTNPSALIRLPAEIPGIHVSYMCTSGARIHLSTKRFTHASRNDWPCSQLPGSDEPHSVPIKNMPLAAEW